VSSGVGASKVPAPDLSRRRRKKLGPKRSDDVLIQAVVEVKARNPRFGRPQIAFFISQTFGVDIDKNVVHSALAKHYRPPIGGTGPSSLSLTPSAQLFRKAARTAGVRSPIPERLRSVYAALA
jgi:hypothetical protein